MNDTPHKAASSSVHEPIKQLISGVGVTDTHLYLQVCVWACADRYGYGEKQP